MTDTEKIQAAYHELKALQPRKLVSVRAIMDRIGGQDINIEQVQGYLNATERMQLRQQISEESQKMGDALRSRWAEMGDQAE